MEPIDGYQFIIPLSCCFSFSTLQLFFKSFVFPLRSYHSSLTEKYCNLNKSIHFIPCKQVKRISQTTGLFCQSILIAYLCAWCVGIRGSVMSVRFSVANALLQHFPILYAKATMWYKTQESSGFHQLCQPSTTFITLRKQFQFMSQFPHLQSINLGKEQDHTFKTKWGGKFLVFMEITIKHRQLINSTQNQTSLHIRNNYESFLCYLLMAIFCRHMVFPLHLSLSSYPLLIRIPVILEQVPP